MQMIAAVCDTCSLIKLRKGQALTCLGVLFDMVYIPEAVKAECSSSDVNEILYLPFIQIRKVSHVLPLGLGKGEREAISLAMELGVKTLLTDDEKAFRNAAKQGLEPIRVFQVLVYAKKLGVISSVKWVLDKMKQNGEGIRDDFYQQTLEDAGEL